MRWRSGATQACGLRSMRPCTETRPAAIHAAATVRDANPARERARSSVISGLSRRGSFSAAAGEGRNVRIMAANLRRSCVQAAANGRVDRRIGLGGVVLEPADDLLAARVIAAVDGVVLGMNGRIH